MCPYMPEKLTELSAENYNRKWSTRCGLDYKKIESQNLHLDDSLYPALGPEALYTSFADYYQLFSHLPEQVIHVCDLGAGVGRLAPVWKELRPSGEVSLVELVESRMKAAREIGEKLCLSGIHYYQADLLQQEIPSADAYFIYLPVSKVLEKILDDLRKKARRTYLICIESHGNLYERLSVVDELQLREKVKLFSQRHNSFGHIYLFTPLDKPLTPYEMALGHSYQDSVLVIDEGNGQWLALTENLVWSGNEELLLKTPPRTIKGSSIKAVKSLNDFSPLIQKALTWMKENKIYQGSHIRKIWLGDEIQLEMLNGSFITLPSSFLEYLDQ